MHMQYRLLGRSGLRVSELCLGTMTFGAPQWGTPESDAGGLYGRFRDCGGNCIDTANEIYSHGESERIVGRLMSGHRHEVVLATKYSLALPGGADRNLAGNSRKSFMRSLEASLRRLGTDYIDLMWVHAWDGVTPAEEIMRALDDAVRQGKLLYTGASNTPAWVVAQCNTLAAAHGWTAFVAIQVEYSLLERTAERELLPMARDFGLAIAAWSPLGSGILTGKYAGSRTDEAKRLDSFAFRKVDERSQSLALAVGAVAARLGCSAAQVALNWLRAQPGVIPVLGVRTLAQLEDNLGCLQFNLNAATLAELSSSSAPPLGFPHDYLAQVQPLLGVPQET
jgi:aryl-alcohol dehydrogenase-like predicted oxidoreductase